MSTADGTVIGTTRIVDHGSPANRWNLVIVAEGYRQTELAQFDNDAQRLVHRLLATRPFDELWCAINVYRVDVSSTDSGADDPVACAGTGAMPATYFDASFCHGGIQRLLLVNTTTVLNVVTAQVPQWHQILVIVKGARGAIGTSLKVTTKPLTGFD